MDERAALRALPEETDVEWLAVRCCCTPTRVFGFLRVPRGSRDVAYAYADGAKFPITIKRITDFVCAPSYENAQGIVRERMNEIAVYSEDRPIEFWRRVMGFVEAA